MTRLAGLEIPAPPIVVIPAFLVLVSILALVVARLAAIWLRRMTVKPRVDDKAIEALPFPLAAAILVGGLVLIVPELALPAKLERTLARALSVVLVFVCALVAARLAVAAVTEYSERNPAVAPALGVVRVAVRLIIGIVAVLMALQSLGVSVTPILTTLGIGSLAVALALQDTLANFFAGLYLLADRPVRPGDYIKIPDGEQGYVDAIGWRSSRLRTLQNNVVIVPNQKLSQAVLTNYHLPEPHLAISIPVGIPYDADPDTVEGYLLDELLLAAGEIPDVQGGEPTVRLSSFGDSALVFTCTVYVRDYASQFRAAHELRKRLFARLRAEGIEVPYPQQVVHMASPPERRKNDRS